MAFSELMVRRQFTEAGLIASELECLRERLFESIQLQLGPFLNSLCRIWMAGLNGQVTASFIGEGNRTSFIVSAARTAFENAHHDRPVARTERAGQRRGNIDLDLSQDKLAGRWPDYFRN